MAHGPARVEQGARNGTPRVEGAEVARAAAPNDGERTATFAAITANIAGWFAGTRTTLADDFVLA